ncbi:hypothetical protein H072_10356 [Dactylellina haptotyla CBS 200.50]|uniref:Terpene synthase n=1 Tax=Dactylellina haptotyla (strain CBS 200.50) TaxID=1284197 RepID=S8BAP3_DACHA|nr:hypothetical protein H072_10356 [Dactylellina haptotyla CBS 200.50]
MYQNRFASNADDTSNLLDINHYLVLYDLKGFAEGYELRASKNIKEVERGILEARTDFAKLICPIDDQFWGNENREFFSWSAVAFQLVRPERLAFCSYLMEFGFLYDDHVLESSVDGILNTAVEALDATKPSQMIQSFSTADLPEFQKRVLRGTEEIRANLGAKAMQLDPICGKILLDAWKVMLTVSNSHNNRSAFGNYEEYMSWRLVDSGAIWTGKLMLFGLGVKLTEEEEKVANKVLKHCFVALILSNDYFSFDKELEAAAKSGNMEEDAMSNNSVWLFMHWRNIDVDAAKQLVRGLVIEAEGKFLQDREEFLRTAPPNSDGLARFIEQFTLLVPGNTLWAKHCLRYNKQYRTSPVEAVAVAVA